MRGLVAELAGRSLKVDYHSVWEFVHGKRDFPLTLTPAVLMDWPSIGRYRAVQAVAALWKLKGSRSVISASPAR